MLTVVFAAVFCAVGVSALISAERTLKRSNRHLSTNVYHEFGVVESMSYHHNQGTTLTVRCHGMFATFPPGSRVYYKQGENQ